MIPVSISWLLGHCSVVIEHPDPSAPLILFVSLIYPFELAPFYFGFHTFFVHGVGISSASLGFGSVLGNRALACGATSRIAFTLVQHIWFQARRPRSITSWDVPAPSWHWRSSRVCGFYPRFQFIYMTCELSPFLIPQDYRVIRYLAVNDVRPVPVWC